jgi:hypothetical protein
VSSTGGGTSPQHLSASDRQHLPKSKLFRDATSREAGSLDGAAFLAPRTRYRFTAIDIVLCSLGLLSLGFSLYTISIGFHNTLFDFHGFRQTQTAISADSILHGGNFLRYETPVLGPPWSLPFEFPLYQGIVAGLSKFFSSPLEQTGRLVSVFFYYLCFFPLASILWRVGLRGTLMIPALALFAVSPIYIFVSRLFMIESTALLLSLLYTDQMFRLVLGERRWQYRYMAGAGILGVLAGLVKVTTLAPFFALGTLLAVWGLWNDRERLKAGIALTASLVCIVLPVTATWAWTKFADNVKAQNPIGIYLTSKALSSWNFGPLSERLHPRIYLQLLRASDNQIGNFWAAVVVLVVYLLMRRRSNWIAGVCLALYVGTILIFFNLHVVHEYYPYANAIFLVVATGALITSVLKSRGAQAWVGVLLLILEMGACGYRYLTHYYPMQSKNAPGRPGAAALIDSTTAPQGIIVIMGLDWSSEFPYQSHRRAIMDATFGAAHIWQIGPIGQAIENAHPRNVMALVACDQGRYSPHLSTLLDAVDITHSTNLHADNCDIYERPAPDEGLVRNP